MKSLLDLIKSLYGSKAIASTIGSKTNVIRLPSGKLQRYLSKDLNIEAASDEAAKNAYNEMKELIPEITKMNDAERLIFEGNLRRLKNKLEVSGLIEGENVSSGIVAIQSKIDELKQAGKELEKVTGEKSTLTDVLKDMGASQISLSKMQDQGLVRATARQILVNDIKAGKIKNITVEEAINMGEPLDPFRQIYGEDALEQLDSLIPNFRNLKTETEAEKLARSKFKFEPDEARLKGSVTIEEGKKAEQEYGINKPAKVSDFKAEATKRTSIDDLIDEYNANQDRLLLTDDEGATLITYPEYNRLRDRNDEIAKALEAKGISSKVEEAPQAEIIQFRKKPTEPEGKANGGRIGYAKGGLTGLDYLLGL
jgi:antitoxin component HigA of HigAB toxin-antitoxin module